MRLKAAHKTAGGGRTGKQIADAVDVHLQDVDGEVLRFKSMIDQKTASDVGTMQAQFDQTAAEIAAAQAAIGAAQQQISDLTAAIIAKQQQGVQLTAQIQTATADLKSSQLQFEAAAQAVRNELNGSKAAILSTLV
jgi:chromosome segregation ATPase